MLPERGLTDCDMRWFAARLSIAVYDTRQELKAVRMAALDKIRQALGGKKATVNYGPHGETYLNIEGRSVEVMPTDTPDDIKAKLENPFESKTTMSITGLTSGAFEAKLAEIKQRIADKQAQGLAKIDGKVADGAAKLEQAVDGVTAKIDAEVDAQLAEFAKFTNGGPA